MFFFPSVIKAIEEEAHGRGYNLLVLHSNDSIDREIENAIICARMGVDGILVSLSRESTDLEHFGKLERDGKTLYRFRIGDYRVYFERHDLGLVVHRIMNKNTLKDFLYRSSLPVPEDSMLQENPRFWETIESATRQTQTKAAPKA